MKNLALVLSGAALATAALALSSALSPSLPSEEVPADLGKGRVITGFNLLRGSLPALDGLTQETPVTVRDVDGAWIEIDHTISAAKNSTMQMSSV